MYSKMCKEFGCKLGTLYMYMLGMEETLGVRQNIYIGVVLNYETQRTKRNETKRNITKRNELY